MKTYLLTGGAGFIGSHLCEQLLAQGHGVINIDNLNDFYIPAIKEGNMATALQDKNYTFYKSDIRDIELLNKVFSIHKIDTVVHIAAMAGVRPSIKNPLLYEEVNVRGTMNILECMKTHRVRNIVFASSSSVYGNNESVPFKETDIVDFAISPYAATKKSCEIMMHVYHNLYNINVACLRFFTVYGPRQRPDLAIHKFTKMILNSEPIPFFGDGSTQRDYTYIDDIIDGVLKSISFVENSNRIYEIFNLGESQTVSLKEMVKTIEQILNKKAQLNKLPIQDGDVYRTFADISKAKKMLDYNPQTKFKQGVGNFIEWVTKNETNK